MTEKVEQVIPIREVLQNIDIKLGEQNGLIDELWALIMRLSYREKEVRVSERMDILRDQMGKQGDVATLVKIQELSLVDNNGKLLEMLNHLTYVLK